MRRHLLIILSLCFFQPISGQIQNQSTLSIPQIMEGEKFIGQSPENIFWSDDSKTVYFDWNPENEISRTLYKVKIGDNTPQKVSIDEQRSLIKYPTYNSDYSKIVYVIQGDLFLKDYQTNDILQLTQTIKTEYNPSFSQSEDHVIYQSGDNFFTWNVHSGQTIQLTDFREGWKKEKSPPTDQIALLHEEEMNLFGVLNNQKARKDFSKEIRESLKLKRPLPIYLNGKRLSNVRISPNLHFVTYRLTDSPNQTRTKIPHYVSKDGFTTIQNARSKVGERQSQYEMGIYDIWKDTSYMLDITQIDSIYAIPAYLNNYPEIKKELSKDAPRNVIIHGPIFDQEEGAIIVVRAMDNKDRWVVQLDMNTGILTTIDQQHDDAWIGGPGISGWNFSSGNVGWLPNGDIWFQSEKTGYSHLYIYDSKTKKTKALTNGKFEILSAQLSKDGKYFHIESNKVSPFDHHFHNLSIKNGKMQQITQGEGNHQVFLSPDEQQIAVRYSYSNQPWELFLMPNKKHAKKVQITHSTTKEFEGYSWRSPEIIRFEAEDGTMVPARIYRPIETQSNGAAVVFVHGAGYLQNVHHWWSGYYREYMFHNLLVDNGYTVLDIDYRASKGYGRDWRTAIYRHMGGKDLSDQIDGAKYLVGQGIDPERIGIYGGSYGGFITMMALFNHPQTFKSGAAIRSVTDWAHYNHPYTSNILNTPALDSIAYRQSSPIYFAEGLENNLLILHGMVDDNVHFQDVVRLSQRLIELGKENWEMAVYPIEKHGFREPSSWTDEYKRIFKLFQETLRE